MRIPILLAALACIPAFASQGIFETPLLPENFDAAAFVEFHDGAERPAATTKGPALVIWTQKTSTDHTGLNYGDSRTPGVRHLRIGFKTRIAIGAVLVRGGGRLSVLKPDAQYPGALNNDTLWIPAERIKNGAITRAEVDNEEYAVWVLPPGTQTRALRFTHEPNPADPKYFGWLAGAYVLSERCANIAPHAIASANAHNDAAQKINNNSTDGTWGAWDNGKSGGSVEISKEHPGEFTLVWPGDVTLRGIGTIWTGFAEADVQIFKGAATTHPREAADADWETVASADKLQVGYPVALGPNWIDFGKNVTARALRLRATQVAKVSHPHLTNNTAGGKRIWLGELLALQPLGNASLETALPKQAEQTHPPIAIDFTLKEPGLVTLVIEDSQGVRVRNLISETPFPAGKNTAWWDGTNDLLRDNEAARHGAYHIPAVFVAPGEYRVRGLMHKPLELRYEFSVYSAGDPPWPTPDHKGGWLTNHTPPSSALFVPASRNPSGKPLIYLGSYVAEGGDGLAWVELDGTKVGGKGWIGGTWTGAPYLACDLGPNAAKDVICFVGSAWEGELRLTAFSEKAETKVLKPNFKLSGGKEGSVLGGIAVHNGMLVCSLPKQNHLLFIDAKAGELLETVEFPDCRGLAFESAGSLLAITNKHLVRIAVPDNVLTTRHFQLGRMQDLVKTGLDDPQQVALDSNGNIYVSDQGSSNQIKVYSSRNGSPIHAIGHAGPSKAGAYDAEHMNHPNGIAIDSNDQLWVAETDFQPKRVSVWTLDGKLVKAFYGPSEYGGGGKLDPRDKTRFYYHGMEFKLDWEHGTSRVAQILFRPGENDQKLPDGHYADGMPEEVIYRGDKRYFANCYNSNPTNGCALVTIFRDVNGIAVPCAALGRAHDWKMLQEDAFKALWPAGVDVKGDQWKNAVLFCWNDLNGDGHMQANEVTMLKKSSGGITVAPDLSLIVSRVDGVATRFAPTRFTDADVPIYDLSKGEALVDGVQPPVSSGGDQALLAENGWTILSVAPKPFAAQSLAGAFKGRAMWSYPSAWPGLHASHEAPAPEFPGELIGTTRLLGGMFTPTRGEVGPMWAINGNMGNMYLFTADGLFVSSLFKDVRQARNWSMPSAPRGMDVAALSLHDENFWPSITQTSDGNTYVMNGSTTSLVRVDGLDSIVRIPEQPLKISADDLSAARAYLVEREAQRQRGAGRGILNIAIRKDAPSIDGKIDDWAAAEWVDIDKTGVAANFNSNSKPHDVTSALAVSGEKLYACFRTGDASLLRNSGETPNAPFKTGGALDIMLAVNPQADAKRAKPAEGDLRLLVTQVKGKTLALIYRAVVPGTKEPIPFSSPWRTIHIDRVEDVSAQVQLAGSDGNFEFSIPLATIGLKVQDGATLRGDVGILRGDGAQTLQRVYWSNKATAITADVPSEAELTPQLWGPLKFVTR